MLIEERIAYGKVIVRIITRKEVQPLLNYFNQSGHRFTHVNAVGPDGHENLVFTVIERDYLNNVLNTLKEILPTAFYTVEKVNQAAETSMIESRGNRGLFSWLKEARRS